MLRLSMLFIFSCLAQMVYAQCNEFYPIKENVRYEYDHFDRKEKLTVRTVNTFKNISGSGSNMKAIMVQEIIDARKNKSLGTSESEWICENGVLHFTMNSMSMMDDGKTGADTGIKVEVTGDKMDVPSNLKVGQTLKDMKYNVKMDMSGMTLMNREFRVKDRKVELRETVTTPAGAFDCLKVTSVTTSEKGIGNGTVKSAMWFAKDAGMIKSESYNDDGKMTSRQILSKIVK